MGDWVKRTFLFLFVAAVALTITRFIIIRDRIQTKTGGTRTVIRVVWGGFPEREGKMWRDLARGFEEENPDIRVELIYNNTPAKANLMVAGGDAPDILGAPSTWTTDLKEADLFEPLDEYIANDPTIRKEDYYAAAWEANINEEDGKQYGLPCTFLPFTVFYNKDLFDKYDVPYPTSDWDWAEYRDICMRLTRDKDGIQVKVPKLDEQGNPVRDSRGMTVYVDNPKAYTGGSYDGPDVERRPNEYGLYFCWWDAGFYHFIFQNGGRVLEEKSEEELWARCKETGKTVKLPADFQPNVTRCPLCGSTKLELLADEEQEFKYRMVMDDPETVEALKFLNDLIFVDGCAIVTDITMGVQPAKLFREGRIAINGPWPTFSMPDYRRTSFDWDIVEPPRRSKDREGGRAVVTMFASYAVCKRSHHKDEAYKFLSYVCGREGQKKWASMGKDAPAMKEIAESEYFLDPNQRPANAEALLACVQKDYSFVMPMATELWNDVGSIMTENIIQMFQGIRTHTPKEAADAVVREGNKILHRAEIEAKTARTLVPWKLVFSVLAGILLVAVGIVIRGFVRAARRLGPIERREQKWGFLGISPWLFGFIALWIGPVLFSIVLSFCRWHSLSPLSSAKWVGFGNYFTLVAAIDEFFYPALWVSIKYALMQIPLSLILGFSIALLLNNRIWGIRLYRTIYFLPAVLPAVATVVLWGWIFRPTSGLLVKICEFLHVDGLIAWVFNTKSLNWLGEPSLIIPSIVLMSLWGVGAGMIIYLAGLQSVPTTLYEAADIDGAGFWSRLIHITIPMVSPVIFFNFVMGVIGSLQIFMQAYLLAGPTGGVGRAANFYMLYLWNKAFIQQRFGVACAMAWILFILIIGLTMLVFKSSPLWVYYEGEKRGAGK